MRWGCHADCGGARRVSARLLRWGWEAFERERASGGGRKLERGLACARSSSFTLYKKLESDNTNIQRTYLNISRDAGSAAVDHDGGHIGACMGAGEVLHGGGAAATAAAATLPASTRPNRVEERRCCHLHLRRRIIIILCGVTPPVEGEGRRPLRGTS